MYIYTDRLKIDVAFYEYYSRNFMEICPIAPNFCYQVFREFFSVEFYFTHSYLNMFRWLKTRFKNTPIVKYI